MGRSGRREINRHLPPKGREMSLPVVPPSLDWLTPIHRRCLGRETENPATKAGLLPQEASLTRSQVRECSVALRYPRPYNGGVPGLAYLPHGCSAGQLPGPFSICAGVGFTPIPDSLSLAKKPTSPVHSLCGCSIARFIPQKRRHVKSRAVRPPAAKLCIIRVSRRHMGRIDPLRVGKRNRRRSERRSWRGTFPLPSSSHQMNETSSIISPQGP